MYGTHTDQKKAQQKLTDLIQAMQDIKDDNHVLSYRMNFLKKNIIERQLTVIQTMGGIENLTEPQSQALRHDFQMRSTYGWGAWIIGMGLIPATLLCCMEHHHTMKSTHLILLLALALLGSFLVSIGAIETQEDYMQRCFNEFDRLSPPNTKLFSASPLLLHSVSPQSPHVKTSTQDQPEEEQSFIAF